MASIAEMNERRDFKGLKLKTPTDFCIGATIDLGRGIEKEAELTQPVFFGLQVFHKDGVVFSNVPESIR